MGNYNNLGDIRHQAKAVLELILDRSMTGGQIRKNLQITFVEWKRICKILKSRGLITIDENGRAFTSSVAVNRLKKNFRRMRH